MKDYIKQYAPIIVIFGALIFFILYAVFSGCTNQKEQVFEEIEAERSEETFIQMPTQRVEDLLGYTGKYSEADAHETWGVAFEHTDDSQKSPAIKEMFKDTFHPFNDSEHKYSKIAVWTRFDHEEVWIVDSRSWVLTPDGKDWLPVFAIARFNNSDSKFTLLTPRLKSGQRYQLLYVPHKDDPDIPVENFIFTYQDRRPEYRSKTEQ